MSVNADATAGATVHWREVRSFIANVITADSEIRGVEIYIDTRHEVIWQHAVMVASIAGERTTIAVLDRKASFTVIVRDVV